MSTADKSILAAMGESLFAIKSLYFNSAYLGPMPLAVRAAVNEFMDRALDPTQLHGHFELDDQVRDGYAKLLGVDPRSIAVSTSVSELVSHVANGLQLKADDEILLMEGDYPSMVLPWMVQSELRGFKIRFAPLEDFLAPDRYAKHLTARTRYSGCSHVMFNTGIQLPIAELGQRARRAGAIFLCDTSQSFGGMPISKDIVANVDVLVGVAYKWLLGPYGNAYGYFTDHALATVHRTHASWLAMPAAKTRQNLLNYTTNTLPGARRFDRGQSAAYLNNVALRASQDILLAQDLTQIARHNSALVAQFFEGLPSSIDLVSRPAHASNIVCWRDPNPEALQQRLAKNNIDVSLREGTVRASFHLFNTSEQVETFLRAL